jgi:hypothetical protein
MFCFYKMAAKFKMASIVKKSYFLLAVMYLFLGRFEHKLPFRTFHTLLIYLCGTATNIWLKPVQEDLSMTACLEYSASNL